MAEAKGAAAAAVQSSNAFVDDMDEWVAQRALLRWRARAYSSAPCVARARAAPTSSMRRRL
jgi:hypothetical protein